MELNFDGPSGTLQIAIALLTGLGTMGYGAYSYTVQSSELDSAESVDATIVSTEIETISARHGMDYSPEATFEYTYEGDTYTSSNVYPGNLPREFTSRDDARFQLKGYEPGETVTAYIPPDTPENAYLKHRSSNKPFIAMGLGALFLLGTAISMLRN